MTPIGKTILWGCAGVALLAVVGVVGLGFWISSKPEGGVKLGNEMEPYALEYIAQQKLLHPGEKVLAYYDATLAMDSTEAAILTNERVIYHKKTGTTTSIPIREIRDIQHRKEGMVGDIIEVHAAPGEVLKIEIAPLNQGETFKNVLMDLWQQEKGANPEAAEPAQAAPPAEAPQGGI